MRMININDAIADAMERMAQSGERQPNDYEKDGILYCGDCNEPKQAWIDWIPDADGKTEKRLVPVVCRCDREADQRRNEEIVEQMFQERLRDYTLAIKGTQPTANMKKFSEDENPNSSISRTCRKYVEEWDKMRKHNLGILFYGVKGTGKSFYASAIASALIEKKVAAVMTTTASILMVLSKWEKEETMSAIARVPLLVIDDLGAERDTSYSAEMVYSVIDTRYRAEKPTIVTTNLDLKEIKREDNLWWSRIYDRVIEMCPIAIPMNGTSRRREIAEDRRNMARDFLKSGKE